MIIDKIGKFTGEFAFLSNFYISPFRVDHRTYPTVEHFYQSMKMKNWQDSEIIRNVITPGKAKRLGRTLPMVDDWDINKIDIMEIGLFYKFSQNSDLKSLLLKTNDAILIEGNTWHDNFWGRCDCEKCSGKNYLNILGKKLMELRGWMGNG